MACFPSTGRSRPDGPRKCGEMGLNVRRIAHHAVRVQQAGGQVVSHGVPVLPVSLPVLGYEAVAVGIAFDVVAPDVALAVSHERVAVCFPFGAMFDGQLRDEH